MGVRHPRARDRRLSDARRWRVLGLLALAEVLGMSLWFSANAVAGHFRTEWSLSAAETARFKQKVQPVFDRFKKLLDDGGDNGAKIIAEVEALEAKYSK